MPDTVSTVMNKIDPAHLMLLTAEDGEVLVLHVRIAAGRASQSPFLVCCS